MKPTNSMTEDSFERARKAFFGIGATTPGPKASATDPLKSRIESPSEESSTQLTVAMASS